MKITRARLKPFGGSTLYESVKGKIKSLIEKNRGDIFQFVIDGRMEEFDPENLNGKLIEAGKVMICEGPELAQFNIDGTIDVVYPESLSTNESLPRQQTVDQWNKLRKMTKGVDIGDRVSDMNKQGANIQYIQNPVDTGIESYEDFEKKNKQFIPSWNVKGLLSPYRKNKIKRFHESFESGFRDKADFKLVEEIVEDLFPKLKARQDKGEKITYREFEDFMKEHGATYDMFEKVMSELVYQGINFYSDDDKEEGSDKMFSYNLQ